MKCRNNSNDKQCKGYAAHTAPFPNSPIYVCFPLNPGDRLDLDALALAIVHEVAHNSLASLDYSYKTPGSSEEKAARLAKKRPFSATLMAENYEQYIRRVAMKYRSPYC